jgi:iduronate 2-sulfatase
MLKGIIMGICIRKAMVLICVCCTEILAMVDATGAPFNILFIAVDDLKPAIGAYGDRQAVTPNLDALADRGSVFEQAYCQQAVCSPSRTSLMTGLRPDSTQVYDLVTHFRETVPDVVTLPQLFRKNGYRTVSVGKIFHGNLDDAPSWDEVLSGRLPMHASDEFEKKKAEHPKHFPAWECSDEPDAAYSDGMNAEKVVAKLSELKAGRQPWFFAVGFYKPHLPFCAPSKYWELYDREVLWPPPSRAQPDGAFKWSGHPNWELAHNRYTDEDSVQLTNPLSLETEKTLRHGYYACVSYTDAQIGKLLNALRAEGLEQNTIVVVWGDHGFHVGDMGFWCKHTNYETATHSPLIFRVPGMPEGGRVSTPVEFVDVYPTLASLCGLPVPDAVDGRSLVALMKDPTAEAQGLAFSQYPRNAGPSEMMGYSVRSERWRYTEWIRLRDGKVMGRELYDFETDPLQVRNHASNPELKPVVDQHSKWLVDAGRNVKKLR